jgi:hypothetical protein
VRATVSDKHVVKDLASITLQEPDLDDYRLQDYDDPARRYQEGYQDDGYGMVFGENDPVSLGDLSPASSPRSSVSRRPSVSLNRWKSAI